MSYIIKEQLARAENYGGTRTAGQIKYLVLHYTGNDGDSAAGNAAYFQKNVVKASAHYFVDDITVYCSVPDLRVAWAVGGTLYAGAADMGGGSMYRIINNTNSISVELCGTRRDGSCQASEATLANAAALCQDLMARYEIPLSRVYRHFDITGKQCPRYLVDEAAWRSFKFRLEESMTQEQFDTMLENWLIRRASQSPSPGSGEARQWAEENGILTGFSDGAMQYKSFCTREQAVLLLHRLWKNLCGECTCTQPPENGSMNA